MLYCAFINDDLIIESGYGVIMQNTIDEQERKALKVWMRGVIQNQKMSAYEWATKAGTSPTNITRFLNGNAKSIPSSRTVAKLSHVSGTEPTKITVADSLTRTLEVFNTKGNRVRYVNVYGIEGKALALELDTPSGYGTAGINKGDTIIVEQDVKIEEEDVFAFRFEHRVLIGQKVGNKIIHHSLWEKHKLFKDVEVIGKVIQCIKSFNVPKKDFTDMV